MIFELANNSINLYTTVSPGVIYRVINKVCGEELYESLPELFPLANLIDMGITNFYDMSGCLNLEHNVVEKVKNNPKATQKLASAFDKDNNKLKLKRGTRISFEELLQFEK